MINNYMEKRYILEDIIQRQLDLIQLLDMKGWAKTIENLKARVESENFKVLVVGEFKRGKSTFINALLGEEVLPSHAKPCTAIINEIKWGKTPRSLLHFKQKKDGNFHSPKEIPVNKTEDYVVIQDVADHSQSINETPYEKVEIYWNLEFCRNGVEIIDSPGLNENQIRQKVTIDYLSTVDAILFVLSCEALASESEIDVIKNTLRRAGHEDIFFICNRFDAIRKRERKELKQYGINKLAPFTNKGDKRIFFISALDALDGRLEDDEEAVEQSNIIPLEEELQDFLINDRGRVKLLRPAIELRRSIQEARRVIPERRTLLKTDIDVLDKRYTEAQQPLKQLQQQREQIIQRIDNFLEDIKREVKGEAQSFYTELANKKISEWVDNYDI